jgi:DNA-binding response OmpR family regulator
METFIQSTPENLCRILFVDNDLKRAKTFAREEPSMIWAKTAAEAIERLKNKDWDVVSLDHDLGVEWLEDSREKNSGMEIVRSVSRASRNHSFTSA